MSAEVIPISRHGCYAHADDSRLIRVTRHLTEARRELAVCRAEIGDLSEEIKAARRPKAEAKLRLDHLRFCEGDLVKQVGELEAEGARLVFRVGGR